MSDFLVIDTSVLVASERGELPLDSLSRVQPGVEPAIAAISISELLHGYYRAQPDSRRISRGHFIESLLAQLRVLAFDLSVARRHAEIWADLAARGEMIGPYDLIIAATAMAHRAPLASLNFREFKKVRGLDVRELPSSRKPR